MAGMLQILTYLLSFYLVIKGVEVLQIAITSNRPSRTRLLSLTLYSWGGHWID